MAEKLEKLVDEIQEHYEAGGSKADDVSPGDPVVTKFSEDEAWYRAYVENIEGSDVTVRFVDYGNMDTITKDTVFKVADDFRQLPGQSLKCRLTGVKPLQSGEWSEDAKEIMQSLIPEAVNVKFIEENPDGTWVVSLCVGEVDVAEELIGAAVAKKEAADSSTAAAAVEFPPQASLPVGSSHQVFVSHVNSPTSLYCQLAQNADLLDELMAKIEEQAASFTPVSSVTEGMACMAKYSSDEAWYRSRVTQVTGNKADILFVDYGNSESSSVENVCDIPPELLKTEPQAIHCKLSNPSGVGEDLDDQLADKEMTLKVVHHTPTCLTVDLFFDDGKPLTEAGSVVQESSPQKAQESSTQKAQESSPQKAQDSIPSEAPIYEYISHAEQAGTRIKCFATYIKSPDKIYLHKEGCESSLETMTASLQEKVGGSSTLINPKSGQICGTIFSEDNAWYRGVIEEVNAGKANVRFIDYGNSEEVETNSLKILPSELASMPPFAYPCSLLGVFPLEGEWSSEVTTQLESLIVDKDLICTFVTGSEVKLEVEGKNVGQCLKDAGLAKYEESTSLPVSPVTSLEKQTVPTAQTTAYISHNDQDGFYLQLSSQEAELGEVIENVQNQCNQASPLDQVAVGDFCCAKFTTDDSWYRACVRDIRGDTVDVLFVDFGNSDTVSKENLRGLGITTPALGYPCCLTGCTTMSTKQQEQFSELTTDAEVKVTFDKQTADRYEVTMTIADDQIVNTEIIQLG
jgi:tudor domain-containing protein 1/4/6/7